MSKFKFELDRAGVRAMMQSGEVVSLCERYARNVQSRCGPGYEVTTFVGKTRANASVHASTPEARRDNLENNTLLKALH